MENNIQVFNEQEVLGKQFRIYGNAENPMFLAKDVADWIEHSKADVMISTIDENEKVKVNNVYVDGRTGGNGVWFLTEDGLYEVLMQSRKPIAKQFKSKVKEILKDIRKYKMYMNPEMLNQALSDPRIMGEILIQYAEAKDKCVQLEEKNEELNTIIEQQKPAVEFTEQMTSTAATISMRDFAVVLQKNGVKMGRNTLFSKLREWKYLDSNNVPYQKYIEAGYFQAVEGMYYRGINPEIAITTYITGKGQIHLVNKIKKFLGLSTDDTVDVIA